jgi:beta-lactamase regulating signal transducer with metallopeptidase domain
MNIDGLLLLGRATIAVTLALLIVLGLRSTCRLRFGAAHAYALWLLVLLLPCACLLAMLMPTTALPTLVLNLVPTAKVMPQFTPSTKTIDFASSIIELWISGVVCFALFLCWQQWRFVVSLGKLQRIGTIYRAQSNDIGPALLGVWRPKIVVPADFASRYAPDEQDLILAHECAHLQRGDVIANALCALLQMAFWFHPLVHLSAVRFRADQELACDAAVTRSHRPLRKTYAEAMLKTQTQDFALPAGCGWQSKQILKERIMQLNRQSPSPTARQIGSAAITTLICLIVGGAWAAQATQATDPSAKPVYGISLTTKLNDGAARNVKIQTHVDEPFVIKEGEGAEIWEESFVLHVKADNALMLESSIKHKNEVIGHPSVLFHSSQPATISIGAEQGKFELTVDAQAASASIEAKAAAKS